MPIKGFACPFLGEVSFTKCLEHAATHTQQCPFTYPILKGMVSTEQEERDGIHVTSLLTCLRKTALEKIHPIFVKPEDSYVRFRGKLAHVIVELAQQESAIVEQRFKRALDGITIVGSPDVIYPEHKLLVDYKTTAMTPKFGPYHHHVLQVNCYRWLVQDHYAINRLEIVYLDMKGTVRCPVPLMPLRQVEEFLLPRARLLNAAFSGGSLPPQVEEPGRWQCWGYCPFSHHHDCWGPEGPPERNRKETKDESRKRAIRRSYAQRSRKDGAS